MSDKDYDLSYKLEARDEWRKWLQEIPFIPFKDTWQIQVIPPFGNAIARFKVRSTVNYETSCSIYLDCYDKLGSYGKPYWEIFPVEGDTRRCDMNDVESLVMYIGQALNE